MICMSWKNKYWSNNSGEIKTSPFFICRTDGH
nr:MAG TPA: hypothetical protein [Caudoviricetes sp.]